MDYNMKTKNYILVKFLLIGFISLTLGACSLPRAVAMLEELTDQKPNDVKQFKRYDVNSELILNMDTAPTVTTNWPSNKKQTLRLATDDKVNITIWNSSLSSLFLTAGQKNVTLPSIRINKKGEIYLPYVGNVKIGGLDASTARAKLETKIKISSPNAQIQLSVDPGTNNSFKVLDGVNKAGTYSINDENISITAALALAGGTVSNILNPQLKLERSNSQYSISLDALFDNPKLDIQVFPNDLIRVIHDSREFQVLGASGKSQIINFDSQEISVRKAIAMAGGLDGSKSNPKGVLLLRNNDQLVKDSVPQIFVFDLTSSDSLFASEEFLIADNDLILMTESSAVSAKLILSLLAMSAGLLK